MKRFFTKLQASWRPLLLIGLSTLPLLLAYFFRIVSSYSYDNDFGRDLVDIFAITQGNFTLLGPKLSFGGLHTGPYYYYLFAPVLFLFPDQPESLLYANALLAWLALVFVGTLWHKLERWSLPYVLLALYWIGISSYFLFSARSPGNAFSYVSWLVVLVGVYPQVWKRTSWWLWGLYGLAWGIVVNFHLAVLFVILPLFAFLTLSALVAQRKFDWKRGWKRVSGLAVGFIFSFAPLVLFELTHNFVMFRNTFIHKSYQIFLQNGNLPSALETSTNPAYNFWLFLGHTRPWIVPSLSILLLLIVATLFIQTIRAQFMKVSLIVSVVISLLLVGLVGQSQMVFHYLFPFLAMAQAVVLILFAKHKIGIGLITVALVASLIFFPRHWYQPSGRQIQAFRETIDAVVQSSMMPSLQNNSFQVYVTREVSTAPIGHEYRYFLRTHGLQIDEPSLFSQSNLILWIAEQPLSDLTGVRSWELEQYGPRVLIGQQTIGSRTVYLFGRQSVQ